MTKETLAAHQIHHGTGEVSNIILAARLANGWTEKEITANCKPLGAGLIGDDDDQDNAANGYRAPRNSARQPEGSDWGL